MNIIETVDIKKSFKNKLVLKGLSLEIKQGEIFGFVGPDGAGKTTFMRTLLGLYLPDSGNISILGSTDPALVRDKTGYVPQQFSLALDMTVWENIALFASLQNIETKVFEERANKLLAMVWLDKFKDRLAGNLSGGMKQKLALVSSVVHNPELLILDEPTTGVDPVSRREFWQMLYRLNREGLTILVSTPYMDEVELCTKIAFFYEGYIKASGSPNQLLKQYPYDLLAVQSSNLRAFLGKINQIYGQNVYLQGEELKITLTKETTQKTLLENSLHSIGLSDYTISPTAPTLEDLFSVLSQEQAS